MISLSRFHRTTLVLIVATLLLTACGRPDASYDMGTGPTAFVLVPPAPQYNATVVPLDSTRLSNATNTPSSNATITPISTTATTVVPLSTIPFDNAAFIVYYAQNGDTLPALAKRFNVDPKDITSLEKIPDTALIDSGALLQIPNRLNEPMTPNFHIVPDSEVVFSSAVINFDTKAFVNSAGGYLSTYREYISSAGWLSGDEAVFRIARDNSINPHILLGLLEHESRWVYGQPINQTHIDYPIGYEDYRYKGLTLQLAWMVEQVSLGYYGWRSGELTHLEFRNGEKLRIDPRLNAGTVSIQYYFSKLYDVAEWRQIVDADNGFIHLYTKMFGTQWTNVSQVSEIFPKGLGQPPLVLPFEPNVQWNFVQGPHGAWQHMGALAAIDLAPSTNHGACDTTPTWVLAAAPGLVIRSGNGVILMDLDGDGNEQTGWNLLYMHIATEDRVKVGTKLEVNERIGHASCEGGVAYGTHIHFARKYNGEWIAADGPIPLVLSGWTVFGELIPHDGFMSGTMIKGDRTIIADEVGQKHSNITREINE